MNRAVLALSLTLFAIPAAAQDLPARITQRAVRAAVKLTARTAQGEATGSGSIIDPRGYVLTNFHVVGHVEPGDGRPGSLYDASNRIEIAVVASARESARTRYFGRVVRADTRLDLALIRITTDVHGAAVPASTRFPTVPLGRTAGLRPGSRLFAFGFPLGVDTINVTSGEMSGFQMNSRNQVAWIRTDAEFNPGNSGGMLLDRQGRLIAVPTAVYSGRGTLEPIELARPVERVPSEWTRSLRRGHIDDVVVDGVPQLAMNVELSDEAVGDGETMARPELHYYALPAERPARVEVSPSELAVALLTHRGRVVREGRGAIDVRANDPRDVVLAVVMPPRAQAGTGIVALRLRARAASSAGLPGWELPPPGEPGHPPDAPAPSVTAPSVPTPPSPVVVPAPLAPRSPAPAAAGVLRGRIVDAATGRPIAGSVVSARAGQDLSMDVQRYLSGQLSATDLAGRSQASGNANPNGEYEVIGLPDGTWRGAGVARGHGPSFFEVRVGAEGRMRILAPIQLSPRPLAPRSE
ncbi:MAG: trypsin-like peptidase domain-containing protein [Sandaracinaceae bacterium]|nr:trypsin-like peptidase domain-containing protein [Sandaracinaceae bacterium]